MEDEYTKESSVSIGVMRHLSKEELDEFTIEIICNEALKTSEIEGEFLDRDSPKGKSTVATINQGWYNAFVFCHHTPF